ncbi:MULTISPECIES: DNA adenine methylase [Microbacterium]|uniref:DNA adenine methylase n=1 Tax=Microbacterium TaxID=33882 RepID=UPI000B230A0A|nr:Dam family site-specific DNA-(adenine-N6)-methyltransferase [Microbacterium oleivorans]
MAHSSYDRALNAPNAGVCESPLRWAGGKRRLLPLLRSILPHHVDRIVEPFFGGGSVSFGLSSVRAHGTDSNADLVNFYDQCKINPLGIIDGLRPLADDSQTYQRIRSEEPTTGLGRAIRFTYLNRTAYFGLYRTNQQGLFNVPYGGGGRLRLDTLEAGLLRLSKVLDRVTVECNDYLTLLSNVESSDVVFIDPPYGTKGDFPFRRYGSLVFTHADHRRLGVEANRCRSLGATVILTLPGDGDVLDAYAGWSVIGERTRGGKIVELCIASAPLRASHLKSGGWQTVSGELPIYRGSLSATGT